MHHGFHGGGDQKGEEGKACGGDPQGNHRVGRTFRATGVPGGMEGQEEAEEGGEREQSAEGGHDERDVVGESGGDPGVIKKHPAGGERKGMVLSVGQAVQGGENDRAGDANDRLVHPVQAVGVSVVKPVSVIV